MAEHPALRESVVAHAACIESSADDADGTDDKPQYVLICVHLRHLRIPETRRLGDLSYTHILGRRC
jgi:hypothetical protein